jgi:hypothetical protein
MNHQNKESFLDVVSNIDANMGGTNIFEALEVAQNQAEKHAHSPQIIVFTDGWISQYERQLNNMVMQGANSIHTVGIGSGANDDFILAMSEALTGETCFVHPNENIINTVSHFIQYVISHKVDIFWKLSPDTGYAFANLPKSISGQYGAVGMLLSNTENNEISIETSFNGVQYNFESVTLPDTLSDTLAKVVGSHYIRNLKKDHAQDALAMTIKLGIITEDVSCVMVSDEVVEGADGLPEQVHIPQMTHDNLSDLASFSMSSACAPEEYLDVPMFLRSSSSDSIVDDIPKKIEIAPDYDRLLTKVDNKLSRRFNRKLPTIEQLKDWGMPLIILNWLCDIKEKQTQHYMEACLAISLLEVDAVYMVLSDKSRKKLNNISQKAFIVYGESFEQEKVQVQKLLNDVGISR